MAETRKIAAILVADVVGYSLLAGADEEGTLSRLRALRRDLIDPAIAAHRGRIVKQAESVNPSAFMTGLSKLLPSVLEGNPAAPLIVERVYYTRDGD
jgi:hypothetical protein